MIFAFVVVVGGYWIARALQPDREARLIFGDRAPHKRLFLATLMALTLALGLSAQAARLGPGAALVWLFAIAAWVTIVRLLLGRLTPQVAASRPELSPAIPGPGARAFPAARARAPISAEANEIYRRAMLRPDPPVAPEPASPRVAPAPPKPRKPVYPDQPNPAYYRLHCRRCGSVLTRAMREYHPRDAGRGNFRTGRMIASGSPTRPSPVEVLAGDAENAYFFSQAVLDQAAIPLTWNTNSEGCCGPEARGGPNVLCHGCGAWALFYNETCYSPRFFAGRPGEVELRRCDPADRFTRQAPSHDKEHWRRVALEQPGVIELGEVIERAIARYAPRFEEAGKPFDTRWARGGAAQVDSDVLFESVCLLLQHGLEISAGVRLDAHVGGRGVMIRVLSSAPVRAEAEETLPSKTAACARILGGQLHSWSFPDGDFQIVLDIPREPIPLKLVSR